MNLQQVNQDAQGGIYLTPWNGEVWVSTVVYADGDWDQEVLTSRPTPGFYIGLLEIMRDQSIDYTSEEAAERAVQRFEVRVGNANGGDSLRLFHAIWTLEGGLQILTLGQDITEDVEDAITEEFC